MSYPNISHALASGDKKVLDMRQRMFDHPISFIVVAGAGASVVCEISNSPLAITQPDDPTTYWAPSGAGTITSAANAEIVRYAPCVAIRFTSTGGSAVVEQKG